MPRVAALQREQAIGRFTAGNDPQALSVTFNRHVSTTYKLCHRFQASGSTSDAPPSGRPRAATPWQDRHIVQVHLPDRFQTAEETGRNVVCNHRASISGQTVPRRLTKRNRQNCRPARRPVLTQRHHQARLQWAQAHVGWTWRQWQNVLISNEKLLLHQPCKWAC